MSISNRPHLFTSGKAIRERNALLVRWLDPKAVETKVLDGIAPTLRQLADALAEHFKTRKISERAVRTYVKDARASAGDTALATRPRGRLATNNEGVAFVGPRRPRGRPKKPPVDAEPIARTEARRRSSAARPPSAALRPSRATLKATYRAQLTAEALHLTGLAPSALHRLFHGKTGWGRLLGRRSGFFDRLKRLDPRLLKADPSALRPDTDLEHSLRLHQVSLWTLDLRWCALLFAYEPRSHFMSAACFVAHEDLADAGATRLPGRPVKLRHPKWRGKLDRSTETTTFHLPAAAIYEFLMETRKRMAAPVDTVWLSPSLGPPDELITELQALAPEGRFHRIPRPHPSALPVATAADRRVTEICRTLTTLLDHHNRNLAYPRLGTYQTRLDQYIEPFYKIQTSRSGRQTFRRHERPFILGETAVQIDERERAEALVAFRKEVRERPHRRSSVAIKPIHLGCDVQRSV